MRQEVAVDPLTAPQDVHFQKLPGSSAAWAGSASWLAAGDAAV